MDTGFFCAVIVYTGQEDIAIEALTINDTSEEGHTVCATEVQVR